uniref:Biphenyl ring cleavage enzyme n=1 Tax=Sphingomonas paucimobilis TaxID=13689 RepID=O82834_SPHPI|nr:biphenyl ring cleavage enzyme [Sphingomonas paucimobilis]BAA75884.1 OH-DDVA oxygenase [Sphingomonas paucimobilis]
MAEIVLGMWTSHGPTLSTTPEQWTLRVSADLKRKHPFRGEEYSFEELVSCAAARSWRRPVPFPSASDARPGAKVPSPTWPTFAAAKIDVAVIMGNDQRELFLEDVTPAITVYLGETIWDQPATPEQAARMPPGIHEAEWGIARPSAGTIPASPSSACMCAKRWCRRLRSGGLQDTARARRPLVERRAHSLGFIYRQIIRDQVVPNLPIIINTFFPPNQPTARRCFELGRAVGKAIRSWKEDLPVAVFGSGGMSHFVIDEDFDRMFFEALRNRDAETLCAIEDKHLQSGTSELKTWIAAAGALFDTDLKGDVVGYEPCYRSEAGTGTANGFVAWQ